MAKYKTNAFEIILRENLIGGTIYDAEGNQIVILDLNYDPSVKDFFLKIFDIRCMYVLDGQLKQL